MNGNVGLGFVIEKKGTPTFYDQKFPLIFKNQFKYGFSKMELNI